MFGSRMHPSTCRQFYPARAWLVLFSLFCTMACARPHFQDPITPSNPGGEQKPEEKPGEKQTCNLEFPLSHVCLEIQWPKPPGTESFEVFTFRLYSMENPNLELDGATKVKVELRMPDMGHGSAPIYVKFLKPNHFEASHVSFFMSGTWEIRFHLKLENGDFDHATTRLFIP